MKVSNLFRKDTGTWHAIEKGTKNVVARDRTYAGLLKKTHREGLMYIKVPPRGKSYIFAN